MFLTGGADIVVTPEGTVTPIGGIGGIICIGIRPAIHINQDLVKTVGNQSFVYPLVGVLGSDGKAVEPSIDPSFGPSLPPSEGYLALEMTLFLINSIKIFVNLIKISDN
jgi:hypothetical protein